MRITNPTAANTHPSGGHVSIKSLEATPPGGIVIRTVSRRGKQTRMFFSYNEIAAISAVVAEASASGTFEKVTL